jgi:hypothetical protein
MKFIKAILLGLLMVWAGNTAVQADEYIFHSGTDWYGSGLTAAYSGDLRSKTSVTNRLQAIDKQGWGYPTIPADSWAGAEWIAPEGQVVVRIEISGYHRLDSTVTPERGYAVYGGKSSQIAGATLLMQGSAENYAAPSVYSYSGKYLNIPATNAISKLQFRSLVMLSNVLVAGGNEGYFGAINSIKITTAPMPQLDEYRFGSDTDWYAGGLIAAYSGDLRTKTSVTNRLQAIDKQGWGFPTIPAGSWAGAEWTAPEGEVVIRIEINGYHRLDNLETPERGYAVYGGKVGEIAGATLLMRGSAENYAAPSTYSYVGKYLDIPATNAISKLQFRSLVMLSDVLVGGGNEGYFGAINSIKIITTATPPVATAPVFNPRGKYISGPRQVSITSTTTGAKIYYTIDGTPPTPSSSLYTAPVSVNDNTTLKAIAVADGMVSSAITSVTYAVATCDPPSEIAAGSVTVDGNLSDWNDVVWTSLNVDYSGAAVDIANAAYAIKWAPDKVYVAIKVYDTDHRFTDVYSNWDTRDAVEIYLHTTSNGPLNYPNCEAAQQYTFGIKAANHNQLWAAIVNTQMYLANNIVSVPADAAYLTAAGREDGDWLYYEVAMSPFDFFGEVTGSPSIASPLQVDDIIGVDVCVVGRNASGYTGMKTSNNKGNKSGNWEQIGKHKLVVASDVIPGDANNDGMVDVGDLGILAANYGGSGKIWLQGDFNGDGLVDVGDLGILAAHYGEGSIQTSTFSEDYAKAFGTTVADDATDEETHSSICSVLGLPLIAGLMFMGLVFAKLEE